MPFLERGQFGCVRQLLPAPGEAGHLAFAHAVLDGSQAGEVLVDDAVQPRSAVVANVHGFWLAAGEPSAALVAASVPELAALVREPTALWATTEAWDAALATVFTGRQLRNEYRFSGGAAPAGPLPADYRLVDLDAAIAARFAGRVDPWVVAAWGGPGAFPDPAFGAAMLDSSGALASFCTTCAIGGPPGHVEAEVEVGTWDGARQRGLATAAGMDFLRQCRERGLHPAWTCAADNEASHRLAVRLGFAFTRQVAGYPIGSRMAVASTGQWGIA